MYNHDSESIVINSFSRILPQGDFLGAPSWLSKCKWTWNCRVTLPEEAPPPNWGSERRCIDRRSHAEWTRSVERREWELWALPQGASEVLRASRLWGSRAQREIAESECSLGWLTAEACVPHGKYSLRQTFWFYSLCFTWWHSFIWWHVFLLNNFCCFFHFLNSLPKHGSQVHGPVGQVNSRRAVQKGPPHWLGCWTNGLWGLFQL